MNLFKSLIYIVFISSILFSNIYSQDKGTLRGKLIDSGSGNALPFGNIVIEELNIGTTSDNRGYFAFLGIPSNKTYTILVSYVGYQTQKIVTLIKRNRITEITVKMVPNPIEMQVVEKVGEKVQTPNETNISLTRIAIRDIERLPQGVETDVFRSLQYLPGITSVGDVSAKYYVRGGESNQNLVLLDGVTLYNPFHAMGIFSSIDPEIINNVEFYKGGFPIQYGGRLSSVMKIITKDGNKFRMTGQASASLLSGKASFETPIPNGSIIIAGRKSYDTGIFKKFFNDKDAPFDFYDMSFKLVYQNANPDFIDDGKFTFHGFFSGDQLLSNNPFTEDFKWKNNILGFKRFQVYDIPLYSEISVSISNYEAEVLPKLSGSRAKKNKVEEMSSRADFTYLYGNNDELHIGMIFRGVRTELEQINGRGVWVNINDFGGNVSIYSIYKLLRWENLGVDFGTRLNLEAYKRGGNFHFEPRVNLTYRLIDEFAIKGSWGLFQQGITTLYDESEVVSVFEPWFITPEYLTPARAIHYNIGFDFDFSSSFSFDVEGYYKILKHLPTLNPDKQFRSDPDLVEGSGQSYGWEFSTKIVSDPFYFTGSYSLSWAYKSVNNWKYYPRYDSRQSVKLIFDMNLGAGWQASSAFTFNTGMPFTPTVGYYHKMFSDDFTRNNQLESFAPFLILGDRNVKRLPSYHRLDLSLSKTLVVYGVKFRMDFNILNLYNRANLFYFDRENGERVNMLPRLISAGIRMEI